MMDSNIDSRYVSNWDLTSRTEINRHITKLSLYYVYGAEDTYEKEYIFNRINSLREYKNKFYPKTSLIQRLFRSKTM